MKKLQIITVLALLLSLFGCKEKKIMYDVDYYDLLDTLVCHKQIESVEQFEEIQISDIEVDGHSYIYHHWDKTVDEENHKIVAKAFYTERMEKSSTKYTTHDVFMDSFCTDRTNHLLIVYVSFADSDALDKQAFEDLFSKQYDSENYLYSIDSYFKYNSYGTDVLDYTFAYYDCDMTIEEAWHYVNDEYNGNFVGNGLIFDIFAQMRKEKLINTSQLDSNKDGYVDATVFVIGDHLVDGCYIYGGAQGHTSLYDCKPDVNNPNLGKYIKVPGDYLRKQLHKGGYDHEGTRMLIHEIGHAFGLADYYDFTPYQDQLISSLGDFDMQCSDNGDWNPYSKFTCGWLHPYVISEDIESITLKIGCSSLNDEAILIPTSKGWNGTAFDEYILIDVISRAGANGFDWENITSETIRDEITRNPGGGVRIYHVDSRLCYWEDGNEYMVSNLDDAIKKELDMHYGTVNSNGYDREKIIGSRFFHQIDIIPFDGSGKFRLSTPTNWSAYTFFTVNDLFVGGDTFSMQTHKDAFPNEGKMNNGGTLDYQVVIDSYDSERMEAIITVNKIK